MPKTPVVFRKWSKRDGGDVIAILYNQPATSNVYECESYMHVGQHSACDPLGLTHRLRLATQEEYAPLLAEMQSAPYNYDLDVRKRIPYSAIDARRRALAHLFKGGN